ncbi:MAG: MBL fold metallo-hydrolase [Anaerolineae bacterium]|nr:MBL fold metallo-hydrolase [Anaerolineae bacterium]
MTIQIETEVLGPLLNNTYLLGNLETRQAVIVDPSFDVERLVRRASEANFSIVAVWLTHAHFDHLAGADALVNMIRPAPVLGLHPADLALLRDGGGAKNFGLDVQVNVTPTILFEHGQLLSLGEDKIEVRHAPGHTAGHVIFYLPGSGVALCGDVIFRGSIGRTDLPGGSYNQLINSIRSQVLTLPGETRLLCGHGAETTVALERDHNPFL